MGMGMGGERRGDWGGKELWFGMVWGWVCLGWAGVGVLLGGGERCRSQE